MNQRTKTLLIVLGVLLVILVAVFWWQSQAGEEQAGPEKSSLEQNFAQRLKQLKATNFDLDIVDSPEFRAFKQYGDIPVVADQKGRANPFAGF